jgi:NADH-quinone oxidoreductase subunit N
LKIIFLFSFYKFTLGLVLGILGSITILFGTVVGLYQVKLLRILAFSSMVYMGQIIMAISTQSIDGVAAGCYLMLIYSIVNLCIFFIIMCFRTSAGWELKFIVDLAELIKSNKLLAVVLMTFMLSLAGVPPFAGFCGKLLLVLAL